LALKLHVIHAKDFVKMTPNGKMDFDSSRDLLVEVASIDTPASELEILLDFRNVRADLTMADIYYLAAELDKHRTFFREKIALLIGPEQKWDNAKFFELCATNRGLEVEAFMSYEEAIDWLFPSSEVSSGDGE
jgi:hypothetical protein